MKYDTKALNEIPFSAVAEKYGTGIVRKGAQLLMHCPWHDDHHPSLNVSPKRINRCKCWACGKSAGVIDFVMEVTGKSFQGACEMLHEDFNIAPSDSPQGGGSHPGSSWRSGNSKGSRKTTRNQVHTRPPGGSGGLTYKAARTIIDNEALSRTRMKEWDEKQKANMALISYDWYEPYVSKENSLCKCLRSFFSEEVIDLAVEDYLLGCYDKLGNPDDVMFPSIDKDWYIHNVKVQHYCTDKQSPRFLHKDDRHTFWLGTMLQKEGMFAEDKVFDCTCFFGEHLISKYPSDTIVLVESPKNAVIGACAFPSLIWIAVGNKNNLTPERLECLRNRKVIVIPDADALEEWKAKIAKCKDIATFTFSSFCSTGLLECGKKGDVADWIIEHIMPERDITS